MKPETKKFLLFAVLPAALTGLFTLAPKAYEIFFETKSSLVYNIVSGPKISTGGLDQQVLSLTVENNGSKSLSNIRAELQVSEGEIEAVAADNSSGLQLLSEYLKERTTVTTAKLHPGESFSISALIKTNQSSDNLRFTLRSDEALGKLKESEKSSGFSWIYGPLAAILAVFVAGIFNINNSRKILSSASREDIIFFIASITNTLDAIPNLRLDGKDIYYARYADLLLRYGKIENCKYKNKSLNALQALLLVKNVSEASVQVIEHNIALLEEQNFSQAELEKLKASALDLSSHIELRNAIQSHLQAKT